MSILDLLLMNSNTIEKGIDHLLGRHHYLLAFDQQGNLLCTFYDMNTGRALMEHYLNNQDMDTDTVTFIKKPKAEDDADQSLINQYKLVILDDHLTLYKEVEELAKTEKIKGYTGKAPKYGINRYQRLHTDL